MTQATRPTVLFVAVPGALGGSNRALLTLLHALEGQLTRVVAAPAVGAMAYTVADEGLSEEYIGLRHSSGVGRLLRFLNAFRILRWAHSHRGEIHTIHANATTGLYMALPASLWSGIPITVWVHDSVSTRWGRRIGRLIGGRLRRVRWAAVSSVARDVIVKNGFARMDEIEIVPNPVQESAVLARVKDPQVEGKVRIGFLGAATAAKGFDLLPDVMAATADLPITWKLVVNRKDLPEETPIWEKIDAVEGLNAELIGRIHDVREAYAQCDIIFNPSQFESFSRVTAEALLNGIPVVASDLPSMRDLLGGSDAGVLFPRGDTDAAATAIRRLVEDPAELARRSAACRSVPLEFEPGTVARHMMDLYGSAHALATKTARRQG